MDKCIIIASDSSNSPGEIYLNPYCGMTLAEYFRDQGKDVLLVLDDMTTHAKYYREIALISGQFPGRESYPGIFFIFIQNYWKGLEVLSSTEKQSPLPVCLLPILLVMISPVTSKPTLCR